MHVTVTPFSGLRRLWVFALGPFVIWSAVAAAGTALPIPCAPGACGATGATQFVTGGAATAVATPNTLTVKQTTNNAILNWSSFNVGAGGVVTFNQPSASAIALNKIYQGSPSQILGQLNANGQVYLVNLNGFLFGPKSTVNVGSLLVSSLPLALTDANFNNGILSPLQNGDAALDATLDPLATGGRTSVLDVNGNPVLDANGKPLAVQIVVQPGAQLTAADQGRLLLAGQAVTNGGSLTAPDGQVILAAGAKVYLQASSDPGLRGLVVEVDQGGTAWNQLGGSLSAARGNVTMVGLAVNQDGRISATTSVNSNGSIRLEAADTHVIGGTAGALTVSSSHGGALTIGPKSEMDILPETSSGDTSTQTQLQSSVTLLGEQVLMQGGSITAPDGSLTAIAAANPSSAAANPAAGVAGGDANARIRIDSGATIDLAGSDTTLPVDSNLVAVQLRSSELADDPTQRNGALHGLTVYVDARNQPPAQLADVSGDVAAVAQNVAQRTETGGSAVFQSEGDAVFANGASINVSGGATTYAGGVMQTSYLVGANGQLYPIATANPLLTYVGVVNPTFSQTYDKWGVQEVLATPGLSAYQSGYVEGAAAGSVQFAAPTLVLQGNLKGSAINGAYQRTPSTAVQGGTLTIGLPGGVGGTSTTPPIDYLSPSVRITNSLTPTIVSDDASISGLTLELPTSYLTTSGFTSTQIYSNYDVMLPANTPLALPAGSTLSVTAARVDVLSSITDSGGTLNFQNAFNLGTVNPSERPGIFIGSGVTLDVRGTWTNDELNPEVVPVAPIWENGGKIDLGLGSIGALLSLGDNVTLRTSGGAWINSTGTVTPGTGGSITLNAGVVDSGFDTGVNLAIDGFGVNGAAGGTFSLTAPRIDIANGVGAGGFAVAQQVDDSVAAGDFFQLRSNLFTNYGFQTFNVSASGLVAPGAPSTTLFTVDDGTTIDATVSSMVLAANSALRPSAVTLAGIATVETLAPNLRPSAKLSFNALPPAGSTQALQLGTTSAGDIVIGSDASITTGVGGSIALTSLDSIIVDGTLRAPGGAVDLHLLTPGTGTAYNSYEVGFLPQQRIELGSDAVIDVSGTFLGTPSSLDLNLGQVYAGGTVSLLADRGSVVTDVGSLISIAGASAALDAQQANGTYAHEVEASAAGSLTVHSGEAISLLGNIEAAAGTPGTTGAAAAGLLDIALTRSESWWGVGSVNAAATFSTAPLSVELLPSVAGLPASPAETNQAVLGVAQLMQSGFDALRIEAQNQVEFSGAYSLNLARELVLDAPALVATGGARATLNTSYLEIGYESSQNVSNSQAATGGTGVLTFSGSEVDLVGQTVTQGTTNVNISSSGDLVLRGQALGTGTDTLIGGLTVAGNLTLAAERIYPVSATSFAFAAVDAPGVAGAVTIDQSGTNPGTPLSAGGAIAITADSITSTGTLYAPFGTITLNAADSLTLGDGSLTSVSGGGLIIPYGETQYGGQQWLYAANNGDQSISAVPTRSVSLTAPAVTITKQATIDLTGGGDLSAVEWVPGSGGTVDSLGPGVVAGLYAIVPTTVGHASPQDPDYGIGSSIPSGQTVYLSGGGGVAAGYYPLLPARYALEPGAFLIQVEPQLQSATPGLLSVLPNGTPVIAGFLSYGSTGLHQSPGYEGFAIYPGSYGQSLAQYDVTHASTYFSAAASAASTATHLITPVLPADAGSLDINVVSTLDADGRVLTAATSGGQAASIDISANDLVVGTAGGSLPADAVSVSSAALSSWAPGSLLLGGTSSNDGASIDVLANSVTIGSGTSLSADQIVLVANQSVDVQSGATLQSNSASGKAPISLPALQSVTLTGASGATPSLLAVSDLNWLIPTRVGGASAAGAATVTVDRGATVASRGSLTFDGQGGVTLNGLESGAGAEWSLGSSSIAFVPAGAQADALSIGPGLVSQLGAAGALRLASSGAINLMTPVTLGVAANGTPTLQALTLSASSINDLSGAAAAASQFGAQNLTLQGSGVAATAGIAGATGGALEFAAETLTVGPNALAVNGFASTRALVSGLVVGQGSGALNVGGDFTLTAAALTADSAAQTGINASGALNIRSAAAAIPKSSLQLGGEVDLSGASLDIAGSVLVPAGIVSLNSGGDLRIDSGATVSAAGAMVSIGNQTVGTAGGSILASAAGNLTLATNSILDVSGAGSAAGGTLSLTAGGAASIGSTLKGAGGTSAAGGSFTLDVGSLTVPVGTAANAFTLLAGSLGSGGFNDAIDVRTRDGDLILGAGATLSANSVTLTADAGKIVIDGTVDANSGALRGALSLFGGTGVELAAGGALHADGAGASGLGGQIEIGTGVLTADGTGVLDTYGAGTISLDAGSTVSAAGAAGMGSLLLRAPALLASDDIAIPTFAADTHAVGEIIVEPVLPFNTANTAIFSSATAPTAADFATVQTAVGNYMSVAGANITARLAPSGGTPFMVEAGVEVIAPGSLMVQSADGVSPALDLSPSASGSNWRFNGAPVDLTIRAVGDITVANSISDGFGTARLSGVAQPVLLDGPSSSIRLVAGADLSSANPLAVIAGGSGTLTIGTAGGATAVVRTGTGDIDLVAANDVVIAQAGDGAYTAGTPAVAPGGSAANPYPDIPKSLGTARSANDPITGLPYVYGVSVPQSSLLMSFPTGGGNLLVRAGQDIVGATFSDAGVSNWQLREGGTTYNTPGGAVSVPPEWGTNLAAYGWNFGTLGGGDVSIAAGRDALNVTAAVADSLLPQYGGGTQYVTSGGLALTAGRDIGSVQAYLADGTGSVVAGGALTAVLPSLNSSDPNVGSAFYLQSSSIAVTARLGIAVDGVFNPTALGQLGDGSGQLPNAINGYYFSYGESSALNLRTTSGDISMGAASAGAQTLLGYDVQAASGLGTEDIFPASLSVQALGGNITIGAGLGGSGSATLYPAPRGQLNLLASGDIDGEPGVRLTLSDAAAGSYATAATPLGQTAIDSAAFAGAVHIGDSAPALITAGGSINELSLSIPKAATVIAGEDLLDFTYFGQNLAATDQTVLSAGRDFTYADTYSGAGVSVGGPGELDVLAGRNISLGFSPGVVTTGNLLNPNLASAQGADLTMLTGLGTTPDFADFLTKIIAPSTAYQAELVNYVESLQGSSNLTFASADTAFQNLTTNQQRPLIDAVFFNELLLSGRAANATPAVGFSQGYAAIDALFPHSRTGQPDFVADAFAGALTLDFSRIYTLSGGNITLLIPGGGVNVGLANPPATLASRSPSTLGIVAEGSGNVDIYSRGDIDVNASRIFTLGGGNILIWSDEGSIDAGRGAKTALSAPPPSVLINSDGTVSLNFSGAATGSGIRTIQTNPSLAAGDVDLIAPVGTVNAGDAGIGAAGNINIAAREVLGLDNINFGGTSTGVPSQVSNIGASLTGASNAAASTSNTSTDSAASRAAAESESPAPLAQAALSWLDVFVTGLGEDNCKPDDIDCLKRQKTAVH